MNNYAKLYWLTRLDSLNSLFIATAVIAGILIVLHFIIKGVSSIEEDEPCCILKKWQLNTFMIAGITSVILTSFLPNKNEAILIMAGGKAMDYIQSDTSLSKVPYQTTSIISEYLDKTLKEMKASK